MSDTREKLIEILRVPIYPHLDADPAEVVADYLIDNGVIVQEWKPAKEPPKESGEYLVVIHKAAQATTLLYNAEEKSWYEVTVDYATNPDGEEVYTYYAVDWWMPLPEVPKGE
jgi:hypothetical protein